MQTTSRTAGTSPRGETVVGVTVISGFLGSGKTTLLRRLVADPVVGKKLAVIVNDLGELGLDPGLVRSASATATMKVTEMFSGCICCTLQGDLQQALLALARGEGLESPPEHILIEPSGVARASELSFAINAIGTEAPVRTDAVITLVDAHNAARSHHEHPELFEDQLRAADLVLLNKSDLLSTEAEREALRTLVQALAPRATLLWTEQARISTELLLGRLHLQDEPPETGDDTHEDAHSSPAHRHAPQAHGIAALTLAVPFEVDLGALEDLLDTLADTIFRIKGVVVGGREQEAAVPTLVQAVGDRVELDAIGADSPLVAAPRRLIFIGSEGALDRARLEAGLAECARGGNRTRTPDG